MRAGFQGFEISVLSFGRHVMEWRAMRIEVAIDGAQRRMKQLCRREWQLITLTRRSRLPWAASIQPLARAPRAAQLLVEVVGNPRTQCTRSGLIRGDQPLAGCLKEGPRGGVEKEVGRLGRLGDVRGFGRSRGSRSLRNRR